MNTIRTRPIQLLLTAGLIALLALPVAVAGAASKHRPLRKPVSVTTQIKQLKGRIAKLERRPAGGGNAAGPAGGDLAGAYPNPGLRPGAVGTGALADRAVTSAKLGANAVAATNLAANSVASANVINGSLTGDDLANGSVTQPKLGFDSVGTGQILNGTIAAEDIGPGAVGAAQFRNVTPVIGQSVLIEAGQTKQVTVTCPQGQRLLSGGFEWASTSKDGSTVISSGPQFAGNPNTTWVVQGRIDKGADSNMIIAEGLCFS